MRIKPKEVNKKGPVPTNGSIFFTIFSLSCQARIKQREFISFVLSKYVETGVDELDQDKLPILLINKYQSLEAAKEILGDVANISRLFIEFQKHLYSHKVA